MNREDMLTKLIAQAAAEGSELITLRAIVEEASEVGANRALARLRLNDERAQDDIDELRELLGAWRAAKASASSMSCSGATTRVASPSSTASWALTNLPV